jgi:competence protein ComEA
MHWKDIFKDYLTFTRKERIGIFVLLILIVIIWFLPAMIGSGISAGLIKADTSWMAAAKQLEIKDSSSDPKNKYRSYDEQDGNSYAFDRKAYKSNNYPKGELFYFDPNTLSAEGWKKLGLREKTIGTIQNYLSKGGHFYKPTDLQKIYGLFPDEFERIEPYIRIENADKGGSFAYNKQSNENFSTNTTPALPKVSRYKNVDINNADTTSLISLPGIGSKLAARIVSFRDKLGGFYSVDQIKETYGLPDSSFQKAKQYLVINNASVKKININTATKDEMKMHPYIKWNLANAVVEYRNQHGEYKTVEDIKKIMLVTEEVYIKASPYLSIQ